MSEAFNDRTTEHVARARKGDADSLAWLVRHLSPPLRLQARLRLDGSPVTDVEPDDLVQETWAIALPKLSELDPRDGRVTPVLVRFLGTTLLRRYQSHLKSRIRRGAPEPIRTEQAVQESAGAFRRMARDEGLESVEAALARLDEDERELLVLHGLEGQSWACLSTARGVPEGTLSSRYSRAIKRLREALGEDTVFDVL